MVEDSNSGENPERYMKEISELKESIEESIMSLERNLNKLDDLEGELSLEALDSIEERKKVAKERSIEEGDLIKTGVERLDDLLLGGFPVGSNIAIFGPPHMGREQFVNSFVSKELKRGTPVLWLSTDKSVGDIQEEMKYVLSPYKEYESEGLVHYIDAYSKGMEDSMPKDKLKRDTEHIPNDNFEFLGSPKKIKSEELISKVDEFSERIIGEGYDRYSVALNSITTIFSYWDSEESLSFLEEFGEKRKDENAITLYEMEKELHRIGDMERIEDLTDGIIELKSERPQKYLRVKGFGDVRTRDYVRYESSKKGITLGSFSLDTIR